MVEQGWQEPPIQPRFPALEVRDHQAASRLEDAANLGQSLELQVSR